MPRLPRDLQPGFCYHVTTRCNNRRFNLKRQVCRDLLLYAIQRAKNKYHFKLYALCIMSNHVHYLIEPQQPDDLPRIMHWLNWYTAMSFNRMLNRTGHFWEQRYFSRGFPNGDVQQALNTLRYIHANPKAAGIRQGLNYGYSNYGAYERLSDDGITEWHPAFYRLGDSLDECAAHYRRFCRQYQTRNKSTGRRSAWGRRWLPELGARRRRGPVSGPVLPFGDSWCQVWEGSGTPKVLSAVAGCFTRANAAVFSAGSA